MGGAGKEGFFFEKKNQKTFIRCPLAPAHAGAVGATRKRQKFFGSFFQKRTLLAFLLANGAAHAAPDGAAIFAARCVQCHQQNAEGADGLAPSLAGTLKDYLTTDDGRKYLSQILVSGMAGRIESQGRVVVGMMPSFRTDLSDADIAATVDYVLAHFNGVATASADAPVTPEAVAAARAATASPSDTRHLREKIKAAAK
jgi:mono/diheme cytochrome c family protein